MIASFFQSLDARGVAYLLTSGQATVLYGAATFSEDVDLWIEPSRANVERFRAALRDVNARYYKLTPPLEESYLKGGHAFHFMFEDSRGETVFLDIMGRPPRGRDFELTRRDAHQFETAWGELPTVGIRDLIELKKTQRLADYPIISALTLRQLESTTPVSDDLAWAAKNLFTAETFFSFNEKYPQWIQSPPTDAPLSLIKMAGRPTEEVPDGTIADATEWMLRSMAHHQLADRHYWRRIVAELRDLRRKRILMAEGAAV